MDLALHALNRFGLGARIGERRRIGDPRDWLRAQLARSAPLPATPGDAGAALRDLRAAQGSGDPAAAARARRAVQAIIAADMTAVLERRVTTDTPVVERLTAFWTNHLCVSAAAKIAVAPLAGAYEREAIRPHVLGRFEDMVLASAAHPAMLLYLDNAQSVGPASRAGRGRPRAPQGARRGLNENYARELLELHTLGVDGGYTQADVQELARILTGWTVSGLPGGRPNAMQSGSPRFAFEPLLHEPGTKTVLGVRYAEAGRDEGTAVIPALARHPSTARFIATKLVRHFISDQPPAAAVDAVSAVFRRTDGDLRATALAVIERPEAWSDEQRKFRTPQDWLVAVLRALHSDRAEALPQLLRQLRHPLWAPGAPNGFGDTTSEWADPDSLMNRAELSRTLARRVPVRFDARELLDVIDVPAGDPLRTMLGDAAMPAEDRIALAIASPAFQWR